MEQYRIRAMEEDFKILTTRGFQFVRRLDETTLSTLEDLKNGGFISRDTDPYHFCVLFGIGVPKSKLPFKAIRWLKNKQLQRFFIFSLFECTDASSWDIHDVVAATFSDKKGAPYDMDAYCDKKRLEDSSDYGELCKILKNLNGRV
ncbi:MAG: hypothetical protein ACRCY5_05420 [Phocaeicola sp.]